MRWGFRDLRGGDFNRDFKFCLHLDLGPLVASSQRGLDSRSLDLSVCLALHERYQCGPALYHAYLFALILSYPSHHIMSSLTIHQFPETDVEKQGELDLIDIHVASTVDRESSIGNDTPPTLRGKLPRWNAKVEVLAGLEARGIKRVLPDEKHDGGQSGYLQMFALWFSINLTVMSITTGLLGPLIFKLGWVDCICILIFANGLSSCGPAYISTFGPESGNRTMVRVRTEGIPRTH